MAEEGPILTPRQLQVGLLVADGRPDKLIAEELGISEETVNHHLKKAFERCGFHSRVQLGIYARTLNSRIKRSR